jgi:hypothetical protein
MVRTYPEFIEAYGKAFTKDSDFIEGFQRLFTVCPALCYEGLINLMESIITSNIELSELHMVLVKAKLDEINKLIKIKKL